MSGSGNSSARAAVYMKQGNFFAIKDLNVTTESINVANKSASVYPGHLGPPPVNPLMDDSANSSLYDYLDYQTAVNFFTPSLDLQNRSSRLFLIEQVSGEKNLTDDLPMENVLIQGQELGKRLSYHY